MAGFRAVGSRGSIAEMALPGDTILTTEFPFTLTATGASTITASAMLSGNIFRAGLTGAATDPLDSSSNIITALAGNNPQSVIVPGMGFKVRFHNTSAQTWTVNAGPSAGYIGNVNFSGQQAVIPTLTWRELLFIFVNAQLPFSALAKTVSGSNVVSFVIPNGQNAIPIGVAPGAYNLSSGCWVSGTGITGSTLVTGLIMGQGGLIGFTMSAPATATSNAVALNFAPVLFSASVGAGTAS